MEKTKTAVLVVAVVAIVAIAGAAVLLLNSNNDNGGKDVVNGLTDPVTGIKVTGQYPSGTVADFRELTGSEKEEALGGVESGLIDKNTAKAYVIKASNGGKDVQPGADVQVTVPASFDGEVRVLRMDSTPVQMQSSSHDGKVEFTTGSLSTFVIGAVPSPVNDKYEVTVDCDDYVKFMINGDGPWGHSDRYCDKGDQIALVAITEVGNFDGYYIGGERVCADSEYTFTVNSDVSIRLVTKDVAILKIDGGNCDLYMDGMNYGSSYEKAVTIGEKMTFYAVSKEGSLVSGWSGSSVSDSPVCSFTVGSDMNLSVSTVPAVNPTSAVGVSLISPEQGDIIAYGQNVGDTYFVRLEQSGDPLKLSAEPATGYSFNHWTMNTGEMYTSPSIDVVAGTERLVITGFFSNAASRSVNATIDHGTVEIDGEPLSLKNANEGNSVELRAIPDEGYRFLGWFDGDKCVSTSATYKVVLGKEDVSLEARTVKTSFSVELSVDNGSIMVDGQDAGATYLGTVPEGGTIVFVAVPDAGYAFDSWEINGKPYGGPKITISGASEDIIAAAKTVMAPSRTVQVSMDHGSVKADGTDLGGSGSFLAYDGKKVTLIAEPEDGYRFVGWKTDGKYVSTSAEYIATIVGDMEFVAEAVSTLHTLTLKSVNGGLIIDSRDVGPEYSVQLHEGESLIVNAAPSQGNTFSEWDIDGMKYGTSYQTIEITMGGHDISAVATNVPMDDETVHVVAVNGIILVDDEDVGSSSVDIAATVGETVKLTAVPFPGYRFDHWTVDGEKSDFQIIEITMGTYHVNAEAYMVKNETHTVEVSIEHGTLEYKGEDVGSSITETVEDGAEFIIKAIPDEGYALAGWYEDGNPTGQFQTEYRFQVLHDTVLTVNTLPQSQ